MTYIIDPLYAQRQPAIWASHPAEMSMEYSSYPHPPPFSSPPATPMTPMTPHHNTAFVIPQYEPVPTVHYVNPPPPPPPLPPPPDYRLFALCQLLHNYQQVPEHDLKLWWDEFMTEFFHENATLAIAVDLGEGMRKFCVTRQWIVCYFKSMLENGVTSLHLNLGQCIRTIHQNMQQLECTNAVMETDISTPQLAKVCSNGSLIVDFSLEEKPRILSWYYNINDHMEYIPRVITNESSPHVNITCKGLLPATQKFLMTAGIIDDGLQDSLALSSSTATPTDVITTQWQEPISLHSALDVNLHTFSCATTITHPPPLLSSTLLPQTQMPSPTAPNYSRAKPCRSSLGKKGKCSPTSSKNQFVLIAAEAVPLTATEDLLSELIGGDERTITRVDNQTKPKVQSTGTGILPSGTDTSCSSVQEGFSSSLQHHPVWPSDSLVGVDRSTLTTTR